ncbi:MAG: DUF2520 domain-containing protein, partial [Chlorobi bacterium]|nr:DUF2520 domain-containing protein [Chlorobiota bacterium]
PTDAKRKALYHAAAVLASNVTTEVVALAQEVARLAGIPPERFLPPILRATVDNAVSALVSGMPIARTGPASRGDNQTLQRHLAALALFPELAERYRLLISALLVSDVRSDRSDRSTRPHSSELS